MSTFRTESRHTLDISGISLPVHRYHTLVIGSGTASLKAADRLHQYGIRDIAVVTEGICRGTSYNTGSDKQTYFRLSTGSPEEDSPYLMAEDLFSGGSMHGDHALIESVGSTEAFHYLASIGVPFPKNRYGAYVGYKTDHDSRDRGSSIGPYTSKKMVEVLFDQVRTRGISIFDRCEVVALLKHSRGIAGALAVDTARLEEADYGLTVFMADAVIFGPGGPGGLYRDSVYPAGHSGAVGLALALGAEASNLQESQFGLASIQFRWNVSGSYQQVIPRYISTDNDGNDRREFLNPFFPDTRTLCRAIFLKGYQWPFDVKKITSYGSSLIDILVYRERSYLGRRVFLDYRNNPSPIGGQEEFSLDMLPGEARSYLEKSGATAATPLERLLAMNPESVELYRSHNIDLETQPLEIAVSAQHNNGGLSVDLWWESVSVPRLFPVGEAAGTHGVSRPGGSALNAGQVGAARAAEKISGCYGNYELTWEEFEPAARKEALACMDLIRKSLREECRDDEEGIDLTQYRKAFAARMSDSCGAMRKAETVEKAAEQAFEQFSRFDRLSIPSRSLIPKLLQSRHLVFSHWVYISALAAYLGYGGGSRGSSLVLHEQGRLIHPMLEQEWCYTLEKTELQKYILTSRYADGACVHELVRRRKIPEEEFWFESVWRDFKEKKHLNE